MMNLREMVEAQEKNFNPRTNLLEEVAHSPGYHTRIPDGVRVSATRTNIYYALALLKLGGEKECVRAVAVTRSVLAQQVTDPYDAAYGICLARRKFGDGLRKSSSRSRKSASVTSGAVSPACRLKGPRSLRRN